MWGTQVRELEEEIEALASGRQHRRKLKELMNKKELVGDLFNSLRLARQRLVSADISTGGGAMRDEPSINATLAQLLMVMERLDAKIGESPLMGPHAHFSTTLQSSETISYINLCLRRANCNSLAGPYTMTFILSGRMCKWCHVFNMTGLQRARSGIVSPAQDTCTHWPCQLESSCVLPHKGARHC